MNAIAKTWPGGGAGATDKRQLILLGCLTLVLIAVLAWEGPKLLHGSGSSNAPAATTAATASAAPAATAAVATSAAATSAAAVRATIIWIEHQPARDPFVPLAGAQATPAVADPAATPAPAAPTATTVTVTAPQAAAPAAAGPTPAVPAKVTPSIAVVEANGQKHIVLDGQYFKVSDLWFRLVAVDATTMKIALVDAAFSGGRDAITVLRDHPVTLVNNATGVEYSLRFTQGTSGVATDSQAEPTAAPSATATGPTAATPPQAEPPATTSAN
jgi:hypothetical protein